MRMIINRAKERKFVLRITYIKKKEKFNTQFPSVISIEIYFHKYTLYNFILSLPLPPLSSHEIIYITPVSRQVSKF